MVDGGRGRYLEGRAGGDGDRRGAFVAGRQLVARHVLASDVGDRGEAVVVVCLADVQPLGSIDSIANNLREDVLKKGQC